MNKIIMEIETPESVWMRDDCQVNEEGTMQYEAKFCKSGRSPQAVHLGPVISLVVLNAEKKEVGRRSVTIGVKSNGELYFQNYTEVVSQVEKDGLAKE